MHVCVCLCLGVGGNVFNVVPVRAWVPCEGISFSLTSGGLPMCDVRG